MSRDHDMDALAEAIVEAQADRSWLRRLLDRALAAVGRRIRRALVKAGPFALFAVAACVLLARTGVDLGGLLMVMFYGSPFLAVAVASFVAHAWRQNSATPVYGTGQEVGQAEPGQVADSVGQVGQPAQDVEVGQVAEVAKPVRPVTVTATVVDLPVPVAITGQPAASYYSPIPERDETKEEIA